MVSKIAHGLQAAYLNSGSVFIFVSGHLKVFNKVRSEPLCEVISLATLS